MSDPEDDEWECAHDFAGFFQQGECEYCGLTPVEVKMADLLDEYLEQFSDEERERRVAAALAVPVRRKE